MPSIYDGVREEYGKKLAVAINKLKVDPKTDPEIYEVKKLLGTEQSRLANKDRITMLTYNYLNSNTMDLFDSSKRERFDLMYTLLTVNDSKLANSFQSKVNADAAMQRGVNLFGATMGSLIPTDGKVLNPNGIGSKVGVRPLVNEDADYSAKTIREDTAVKNLKTLYNLMNGKSANSMFHWNSAEYDGMVKAIKNAIDYAEQGPEVVDRKVLKEMFRNVSAQATKYIEAKEAAPSSKIGKTRLNAAFAAVYAVDTRKAASLLKDNSVQRGAQWETIGTSLGDFEKLDIVPTDNMLSMDKIISETGIDEYPKMSEKMESIEMHLKMLNFRIVNNVGKPGFDRMKDMARYVVERGILHNMKETDKDLSLTNDQVAEETKKLQFSGPYLNVYLKHVIEKEPNMEAFSDEVNAAVLDFKKKEEDRVYEEQKKHVLEDAHKLSEKENPKVENPKVENPQVGNPQMRK